LPKSDRDSDSVIPLAPVQGTTRESILAAAQRLFDERGYDATSLRLIAETVGTTKAAVYYHFPAKEQMLLELTRPMLDGLADLVAQYRDDDGDTHDAITVLGSYLDLFLAHLDVIGLLAREPATQNHPDVGRRLRLLVEAVRDHIAGTEPTPERRISAACALGVVHAVSALSPELAQEQRSVVLAAAVAALSAAPAADG
jgi:AcrR family transcriptional regulator